MITPMQMYWLLKLDDIGTMFSIIVVTSIVALFISGIFYCASKGAEDEVTEKISVHALILSLICSILFLILNTLLPTTKQMAAIYVVPALVNNGRVQNIGNKTLDISEDLLKLTEQYLQDVSIDKR